MVCASHSTHSFTAQMSSQLMQTEMLRSHSGPVELLNDPYGAFALGGAPVRKVTTTNVVKVDLSKTLFSGSSLE